MSIPQILADKFEAEIRKQCPQEYKDVTYLMDFAYTETLKHLAGSEGDAMCMLIDIDNAVSKIGNDWGLPLGTSQVDKPLLKIVAAYTATLRAADLMEIERLKARVRELEGSGEELINKWANS